MARGPVASAPIGTHCPQVQDVVKCQMGMCRGDESEDSPDSCKNGQLQILVSEEAWAEHGWVLSVPPRAPYPKHLTFPSMRVRGQRRGLIQAQPLASGWNWASLSPSRFPHLSAGAGVEHAGPFGLCWVVSTSGWIPGQVCASSPHPDTLIHSLPTCSVPLCL